MNEIEEIVNKYIDVRLEALSNDVYMALVHVNRNVIYERVRTATEQRFRWLYSLLTTVDDAAGKYRCEIDRAKIVLGVMEEHALVYTEGLEMKAH